MQELIVNDTIKPHTFSYQRGKITVTGVKEIKSFDDKCIVLQLDNQRLTLRGYDLTITELVIAGGSFGATGTLQTMTYTGRGEGGSLIKRLTK